MPRMDAENMAEFLISRFQEPFGMRLTRATPVHITEGFETSSVMNAFATDTPLLLPCGRVLLNQLEIPRKKAKREHGIIFVGGILHPDADPEMDPIPIIICNVDITGYRAAFIQRLPRLEGTPPTAEPAGVIEIRDHR